MRLGSKGTGAYLLKVMYGQPYFRLCIVDATQVAPSHSKAWMGLYSLHVTCLQYRGREREWKQCLQSSDGSTWLTLSIKVEVEK